MSNTQSHLLSTEFSDEVVLKRWRNNDTVVKIESERKRLAENHKPIQEFKGEAGRFDDQLLSKAVNGSKSYINCLRLLQAAWIIRANSILELGTNLGISSAYLALGAKTANAVGNMVTGDCSGKRINIARNLHSACGLSDTKFYTGYFEATIEKMIEDARPIDLCFIDGDHTYDGTLTYFRLIQPHMREGGLMIFDDIDWSDGMRKAWDEIRSSQEWQNTFEIEGVGYAVL